MIVDNAQPAGQSFFAQFNITDGSVVEIISPASNTSGIIIRTLYTATSGSATDNTIANVYADTSAPSGIGDTTKRIVFVGYGDGHVGQLSYPISISAGWGLWVVAGSVSGNLTDIFVTYDAVVI